MWLGYADIEAKDANTRPVDAEQRTVNAKLDFLLFRKVGLSVWGNYVDNETAGRSPDFAQIDTDGELYGIGGSLAYPVQPWLWVGVEGAYASGDKGSSLIDSSNATTTVNEDLSQYQLGGFIHAVYRHDDYTFAATPRLRHIQGNVSTNAPFTEEGDYDTTEAMLTLSASRFVHPRLRLEVAATPTWTVSERHPVSAPGSDSFNANLAGEVMFMVLPTVGIFAGYSHDVFDSRWDNHYLTVGVRTLIWGEFRGE